MPLAPGIKIGAGGMGEVYRARDTRLDRNVAIKILPASVAGDPDRLVRFEREAKALAALNHPNVAHIHGVDDSSQTRALVMELVEGEDLHERLRRGPISIADALPIARQIAEALEAAHGQGIVHRDLKPANIKVRADGAVKVLDFGLAKAIEPGAVRESSGQAGNRDPGAGVSQSPTITTPAMTQAGIIIGTAAYMSPEQAKGGSVDRRADIWAFGCVLYEMLAGARLFDGADVAETLAAVLRQDPDWTRLPADTPPAIHRLLRRCLVRDARLRLPDIGVARMEIDEALVPPGSTITAQARRGWPIGATVAAGIAGLAIGAALVAWLRAPAPPPIGEPRALQVLSGKGIWWPRISPDGRSMVFVRDGRLFVRALDGLSDREIEAAGGVTVPTWSPDGSSIAYFATGDLGPELRVVPAQGGASRILARRMVQGASKRQPPFPPFGLAWCASGLLFARWAEGLWLVTEDGRESLAFPIDAKAGDTNFSYPSCLPDGRVLTTAARGDRNLITVLGDGSRVTLADTDSDDEVVGARWPVMTPGHVLFERGGDNAGIWALPVNGAVTASTGPLRRVLAGGAFASVSPGGLLVAMTGWRFVDRQLQWVDRTGKPLATIGRPQAEFLWPSISPAGDRVVAEGARGGTDGIWIHGESSVRALVVEKGASSPSWSPRDDRIAYLMIEGKKTVLVMASAGGGEPVRRSDLGILDRPTWTPDAGSILYTTGTPLGRSIWLQPLEAGAKPRRLATGVEPAVSLDGKYLAFTDNSTGQRQIYITTFPEPGELQPVSEEHGRHPRWSRRGDELFFLCGPPIGTDPNSHRDLCVAPFDLRSGKPGPAKILFNAEALGLVLSERSLRGFEVGPDPNRILVQTSGIEGTPTVTLLENFPEWIRRAR
jgi:hypothetical protein